MVVSWISMDPVPRDGSCFDPPVQVWAPGGFTGSSPPVPFPYPVKPGCQLADSEVSYAPAAGGANASSLVRNASLLFADHDVDSADSPTNTSTPRVVHVVRLSGLRAGTKYEYRVRS